MVGQTVKNLPIMQETRVQFLGQEVPLQKEMATHSTILAWRIPWTEKAGGLQSMVLQRVGYDCGNSVRLFCQTKSLQMVIAAMKLKDACSLEGKL